MPKLDAGQDAQRYRTNVTDRLTVGSCARHLINPAREACKLTGRARAGAAFVAARIPPRPVEPPAARFMYTQSPTNPYA